MAGKVKSGLDHALKSMLGVDTEELARFGQDVGKLLADFRDSLVRIEGRLAAIERRLDGSGYYRGERSISKLDGPEVGKPHL